MGSSFRKGEHWVCRKPANALDSLPNVSPAQPLPAQWAPDLGRQFPSSPASMHTDGNCSAATSGEHQAGEGCLHSILLLSPCHLPDNGSPVAGNSPSILLSAESLSREGHLIWTCSWAPKPVKCGSFPIFLNDVRL